MKIRYKASKKFLGSFKGKETIYFYFLSLVLLWPRLRHMEVPRLGGLIRTTAAGVLHSHSNARSLTHWVRPGIESTLSWFLVGFVSAALRWELPYHNILYCKVYSLFSCFTVIREDMCLYICIFLWIKYFSSCGSCPWYIFATSKRLKWEQLGLRFRKLQKRENVVF